MRVFLIFVLAAIPAFAQRPVAQIVNLTRGGTLDFQVGDRFELVITAWANEPVSVRTTRSSMTDWSRIIGWTDQSGHWASEGKFEKADFGAWSQGWTVGGKLTAQPLQFFVAGSCLPGHPGILNQSGPNISLNCETANGEQNFVTPSFGDSFRTPDGRVIPGLTTHGGTPEQRTGFVIEEGGPSGQSGDDAAVLITKVIDANALNEREIRNVIQIIRLAFQNLDRKAPASNPIATIALLKQLANQTEMEGLKKEIAATVAFIQAI